ncbi:MAG: SPOR domain-containing protein [Pseudomonadota bacterium]
MARSGARKKTSGRGRQAIRDGEQKVVPGWVWLLLGVAMGVCLSVFLVMAGFLRQPRADLPRPNPTAREPAAVAAEEVAPKDEFDFFTVLPEMEVVIPEAEIEQRVNEREELAASRGPYLLQVASLRRADDAERMKAELAFLGLVADVVEVKINDVRWHRVRIGPMTSLREIDGVKRQLQSAGYSVLVLSETQ